MLPLPYFFSTGRRPRSAGAPGTLSAARRHYHDLMPPTCVAHGRAAPDEFVDAASGCLRLVDAQRLGRSPAPDIIDASPRAG